MANKSISIATQHKDEIINRIAKGEALTAIAESIGYTNHSAIINRLGEDKEYQDALRAGVIGKLEKREQALELAQDNVTVTRANHLLNHSRWWAERLDPQRFGAKQDQQSGITIHVHINDPLASAKVVTDEQS